MKTLKIHLIRHGATDANKYGQYIGSKTDLPLSAEGVKELMDMKELVDYPEVDRVYSSPLLRAKQSAGILYPNEKLFLVDNFKEYDFGDFEGKTAEELEGNPYFTAWASGQSATTPNGESNPDFIKRLCVGLNQVIMDMLQNEISESAVMMHGGAIMMLLGATAVPQRKPVEWIAEPGQGYSLLITPSFYQKTGVVEVFGVI